MEDDLWWKRTFVGWQPLVGRLPSVEDDLRWKTTFGERRVLVEDDPCILPSPLCGIFLIGLGLVCDIEVHMF